jgi:hypothetical protein
MHSWQGPILLGGDFNLVRSIMEKSNRSISHKWADAFNDCIDKWGLVELNPSNRLYTWINNQDNPILAKLDRFVVSTSRDLTFPLSRVKALDRIPSDHNPILVDTGDNVARPKKKFRFEKWWLKKESFKDVIIKAWTTPCPNSNPIDI